MCDQDTAADNDRFLAGLSRRQFATMTGAAGIAAMLPAPADAVPVRGREVVIRTPDGEAQAYFTAPATGRHPAVLIWPDIMGLRPTFEKMADRLAQSGYAVLAVNQFYRSTRTPFVKPGESFDQPEVRARIMPWVQAITPNGTMQDARAFVSWLDQQHEVDTKRGAGTTGYCMGGPFAFRTAAARADRIRAVATFHGGGLVTDKPDSPSKLIPDTRASYLVAIAANDDERSPNDKTVLREAFAAAKRPAEVEVYAGTMHGWTVPDSRVYNQAQAEHAWARLLVLLPKALS